MNPECLYTQKPRNTKQSLPGIVSTNCSTFSLAIMTQRQWKFCKTWAHTSEERGQRKSSINLECKKFRQRGTHTFQDWGQHKLESLFRIPWKLIRQGPTPLGTGSNLNSSPSPEYHAQLANKGLTHHQALIIFQKVRPIRPLNDQPDNNIVQWDACRTSKTCAMQM